MQSLCIFASPPDLMILCHHVTPFLLLCSRWKCVSRISSWLDSSCACAVISTNSRSSRPAISTGGCWMMPPMSWKRGMSSLISSVIAPSHPPSASPPHSSSLVWQKWTSIPAASHFVKMGGMGTGSAWDGRYLQDLGEEAPIVWLGDRHNKREERVKGLFHWSNRSRLWCQSR